MSIAAPDRTEIPRFLPIHRIAARDAGPFEESIADPQPPAAS